MRKLALLACFSLMMVGVAATAATFQATAPPLNMGDATTDVMLHDTMTAGATAASSPTSLAHPRSALGDRPADGTFFLAQYRKTASAAGIDGDGSRAITT